MRKILLTFVLVAVISPLFSQVHILKTNPLGLALANFNLTYEYTLNESSSILATGNYSKNLLGTGINTTGASIGYRYYITHKNLEIPSGFYVNPTAGLGLGSYKDEQEAITVSALSLGGTVGYQWKMNSGFVFDLGIGPSYNIVVSKEEAFQVSGFAPSFTLAVGYAF